MSWIIAHQAVVTGFAVAVLDFVFAVSPGLKSNGFFHCIYLFLTSSKE